jgi:hypothetical protein
MALSVLVVLNWVYGAGILALLVAGIVHEQWTFTALGVAPTLETRPLITGMRAIAVLGLAGVPLNHAVLVRLRATVETVRRGDPFIADNAHRLQAIAWVLLGLQLLGVAIGAIAERVSTAAHPLHLDAGLSTSGWLAVVLTFVLARVFAEGTRMREDLEGTV